MFSCVKNEENKQVTIKESDYFNVRIEGVQTGGIQLIPIETPIGKFKVWTKRFGNNPKQKVLLLHGGPGSTHEYFECFESFFPKEGIEFIYYDQLGSAYSDQPTDTSLWTIERFVEEVEQVRTALGLNKDNFFLLGHSWGGILAMEYALKYQDNLKGLIISNMMSSCIDYDKYAEEVLAKQMPASAVDSIRMLEAKGDFGNPKYMEILMTHFYPKHVCRMPVEQWTDPMNRGLSKTNQQIYVIMQGPSEFGISGRLEKWDRKNDLKNIKVPTLTIGGTHDTMDPKHMEWMAKQVQNGSFLLCPNGSHMSMYDDQQTYMQGVINFIKQVQ
ncbi:MAG: proline-specific peptidase family protein [Thermoflexibacter sp.]